MPSSPDGRGRPGGVGEGDLALFTDLYEITMAAAYHRDGLDGEATFDLFVRDLPPQRGYLVVAGIDRALSYLEGFAFSPAAVDYLRGLGFFGESFLEHLSTLRFTGEVWAIPEGEVAFAEEPLLSVTAPLMEAQLVETFLLNAVAHQTMIASKASRIATACGPDRSFVDFSPRRDHGTDAAIQGARASVLGGATGTSLVLAGAVHGPVSYTHLDVYKRQPLLHHLDITKKYARELALSLLSSVGIPEPERRMGQYPHEMSGGMRQRVMIAIAIACGPKLLLADEPTTALDVTVQAQILDLLEKEQRERYMAMILVTHDLGVVAGRADAIAVMYAGRIVEIAPTRVLFSSMRMPYTEALMRSIPRISEASHTRLHAISGRPPELVDPPPGCRFAPRCDYVQDRCWKEEPPLIPGDDPGHSYRCWFPVGTPEGEAALARNRAARAATATPAATAAAPAAGAAGGA